MEHSAMEYRHSPSNDGPDRLSRRTGQGRVHVFQAIEIQIKNHSIHIATKLWKCQKSPLAWRQCQHPLLEVMLIVWEDSYRLTSLVMAEWLNSLVFRLTEGLKVNQHFLMEGEKIAAIKVCSEAFIFTWRIQKIRLLQKVTCKQVTAPLSLRRFT